MITLSYKGDLNKTNKFLKRDHFATLRHVLKQYGKQGVDALSLATPRRTGKTANSWSYKIKQTKESIVIEWNNSNIQNGVPIALILQYGHGTSTGGYVTGIDYINPALRPIFDEIAQAAWKEVTK